MYPHSLEQRKKTILLLREKIFALCETDKVRTGMNDIDLSFVLSTLSKFYSTLATKKEVI
jgi:hypothetical protein